MLNLNELASWTINHVSFNVSCGVSMTNKFFLQLLWNVFLGVLTGTVAAQYELPLSTTFAAAFTVATLNAAIGWALGRTYNGI